MSKLNKKYGFVYFYQTWISEKEKDKISINARALGAFHKRHEKNKIGKNLYQFIYTLGK